MIADVKSTKPLSQLKCEDIPVATCETIGLKFTVREDCYEKDEAEAERVKAVAEMDEYLAGFCASPECPACGTELRGKGLMHAIFGGFRWGIANGEGHCSGCGYPCRAYHRNVGVLEFLEFILAYHPIALEESNDREMECAD